MGAAVALNGQLQALRDEWRDWRAGRTTYHWYGLIPWCEAGAAGRCSERACEGCCGVAETRLQMQRIETEAASVKAKLAESRAAKPTRRNPTRPVQESLFP